MAMHLKKSKGFSLIELMTTLTIVAILSAIATPMIQVTVQRKKESELRENLRLIRDAIDAYKQAADDGRIKKTIEQTGYPPNLEILVEGAIDMKDVNQHKLKFLRRIPLDPMINNHAEQEKPWGLRSYESESKNPTEGDDVYDIYSLSEKIGVNKVPYALW